MSRTGSTDGLPDAEAGATLIEVLIVLSILALTVSLSLPWGRTSMHPADIDAVAAQVAAYLRNAQTRSIAASEEVLVTIDLERRRLSAPGRRHVVELPSTVEIELVAARRGVGGRQATIGFFPSGSSTGGSLRLRGPLGQALIEVSWLTGRVQRWRIAPSRDFMDE